jgi:hypothetical protein
MDVCLTQQIVRIRVSYYIDDGRPSQTSIKYQIIKSVSLAVEILRLGICPDFEFSNFEKFHCRLVCTE